MAASPNSVAATSDMEMPNSPQSPPRHDMSRASPEPEPLEHYDWSDLPEETEDEDGPKKPARRKGKPSQPKGANGQQNIGKIPHLKKEDGEPLWRKDIQYDFLRAIFDNEQKVFTNSYEPEEIGMQTFADLYIDTMSRSSKTSKVLRDKLLSDREAAKGMAMVCLLVNVGRMNTTLNFFPEMRAQLRTYHAIPSLQARQDPHAYKQLQDAPRLKSILKGGAEDRNEPTTLEKLKMEAPPRTNPVNLIFIMCSGAAKIAELHFPEALEFHDLIMRTDYTSESRARAFLWLMWFHLESDFTEEGCDENPFGPGVDYNLDVANQGVPRLKPISPAQIANENVDTAEELEFGREKQRMRAKILEMDQAYLNERESKRGKLRAPLNEDGPAILPRIRPSKHESDMDSMRSTPPVKLSARAAASSRRGLPQKHQLSSPARPGSENVLSRKPRPPTAHQLAVERNRNERVEHILDRGLRKLHHKRRKARRQDGAIYRAYMRLQAQEDVLEDSDVEEDAGPPPSSNSGDKIKGPFREKGLGGLCLLKTEEDDFGEEVGAYAAALRRSTRRLARWRGHEQELGVIPIVKKRKPNEEAVRDGDVKDADETLLGPDDGEADRANGDEDMDMTMGDVTMDDVEADMEDPDQTIAMDDVRGDDDVDDADKTEAMGGSDVE